MKITENYILGFDPYNVIVKEKFEKKDGVGKNAKGTGEFDYKPIGYFKNIETACSFILTQHIQNAEAQDIRGMIDVIQDSRRMIAQSVESAGIDHRKLMEESRLKKDDTE